MAYIPTTDEANQSVDKLKVPDLSKVKFTTYNDVEGDYDLEDIFECAFNLVD
jgi:hypothetical protein